MFWLWLCYSVAACGCHGVAVHTYSEPAIVYCALCSTACADAVHRYSLQWVIEGWSQIKEQKKYSEKFEIGTHLW
jgi:hypothetical protein